MTPAPEGKDRLREIEEILSEIPEIGATYRRDMEYLLSLSRAAEGLEVWVRGQVCSLCDKYDRLSCHDAGCDSAWKALAAYEKAKEGK